MAHIRINCADCGVTRRIHKYMPEGADVRFCPFCGSEIDADIWETYVLPAAELTISQWTIFKAFSYKRL